ncbi:kinase-like domain-containing protein [Trametes maxima]|nr:kinase-like domain-containing protein [Trametes maxima]
MADRRADINAKFGPATQIPYPRVDDFGFNSPGYWDMLAFWQKCRPWLAARGYALYPERRLVPPSDPRESAGWFTPISSTSAPFPYATCVRKNDPHRGRPRMPPSKVAWAQDVLHRDVVLKLIDIDSPEYGIYYTLLRCEELSNPERSPGVLPPLAILDTPFRYSIVVMPMWGGNPPLEDLTSVTDIFQFMRCVLRGLVVLHAHRIAHRDIDTSNMLINYYDPTSEVTDREALVEHIQRDGAHYCLFDFNLSIQLPLDACLRGCRRPAIESFTTLTSYMPDDTALGEPLYNPFAFDVGSLGNLIRYFYWGAASAAPLLAPLFDMMTTHDLARRFTAEEALEFLDYAWSQVPESVRDAPLSLRASWNCWAHPEMYWSMTPPGFEDQWSHYKTPPRGTAASILSHILRIPYTWPLVVFVRQVLNV